MDAHTLFTWAGRLVLPGWLLLVLLPRWRYTTSFVTSILLPGILACMYLGLFLTNLEAFNPAAFGTLAGVKSLFQNDDILLAGWIHYLAFDLFIGSWEVRDARALGIHHLLVVPCLVLTFMLGPIGLLLYFTMRAYLRGRWTTEDVEHATVSG